MEIANTLKEYNSSEHLVYSCQYHTIFTPKYRRKVLINGIDTRLKEIIYEVAEQYKFNVLEMEVMEDHVHLLIDCNPRFGIMECIKKIKMISANKLKKEFPKLQGQLPNVWTRSAFISTVGAVSLETVKKYIENQKNV